MNNRSYKSQGYVVELFFIPSKVQPHVSLIVAVRFASERSFKGCRCSVSVPVVSFWLVLSFSEMAPHGLRPSCSASGSHSHSLSHTLPPPHHHRISLPVILPLFSFLALLLLCPWRGNGHLSVFCSPFCSPTLFAHLSLTHSFFFFFLLFDFHSFNC